MTDQTETDDPRQIRIGRRVICRQQGPHNGKRGRVSDRIGEAVVVTFSDTQMVASETAFEPVTHE